MDPFDIFPVKVWEEILNRLEDPLDKWNLIKTNRSLELLELFQENKAEWYFSAVLGILLNYFNRRNWHKCTTIAKAWHGKRELKSALLNCRLVSKGTKKVVDSFVADYWEKYCYIPQFAFPVCITCSHCVDKCLEHAEQLKAVKNRSISPFICGGLLYLSWPFKDDGDENALQSMEKSAQLVSHSNIGNNLRGIRILVKNKADSLWICKAWDFIKNLLQSAPNIISLSILFCPTGNQPNGTPLKVTDALPELPYLKHINLSEQSTNPGYSFFHVDFKQNLEQLTSLEIAIHLWKYNSELVQFPKLKSLHLNQIPSVRWDKDILKIIQNFNAPPLQFLSLETETFFDMNGTFHKMVGYVYAAILPVIESWTPNKNWDTQHIVFPATMHSIDNMAYAAVFSKRL